MADKIKVVCNECGRKWKVSAERRTAPQCTRCNSVDIDPVEEN